MSALAGGVLVTLLGLNLWSFILFGIDKRRARRQQRRIPERTLLLSAVLSGCIGAWLGMRVFRHKTRKPGFRQRMVVLTLVDAAIVAAMLVVALG